MAEVVLNPETGKPAVAETHYRELELATEQALLASLEEQLTAATTASDTACEEKCRLESAVTEQKSLVEGIEAVTPAAPTEGVDDGTTETSSEVADGTPETETPQF